MMASPITSKAGCGVNELRTIFDVILCIMAGVLLTSIPLIRRAFTLASGWSWHRAIISLFLAGFLLVGWTKGPIYQQSRAVSQFILALVTGGIRDDSGLIAAAAEAETVAAFADYAAAITSAASQTVVNASSQFDDIREAITNDTTPTLYLQCYLPRADHAAGITNHNMSATLMRSRQRDHASMLSRWIYFSNAPLTAPSTFAEVDVGGGYLRLESITNSFPDTETVLGLPCVRYDYAVPPGMRGVVLFPDYDLQFGSEQNGLTISSDGVIVETPAKTHIGRFGSLFLANGRVEIIHHGGIATSLKIDGETMTNGVYAL